MHSDLLLRQFIFDSWASSLQAPRNFFATWWTTINWGTVPEWIAAIGTVAAFGIAAVAYLWNVDTSRKAQARMVTVAIDARHILPPGAVIPSPKAWSGINVRFSRTKEGLLIHSPTYFATVSVTNRSDETMGPFKLQLVDQEAEEFIGPNTSSEEYILPGQTITRGLALALESVDNTPITRVRLVFRDAAGLWWQRLENEPVQHAPRRGRPSYRTSKLAQKMRRR